MMNVRFCLLAICAVALSGCMVPQSRLTKCQEQHELLAERHRAQAQELARVTAHAGKIEEQLFAAEEQLAALGEASDLDRRRLANLHNERNRFLGRFALGENGRLPAGVGDQLAALSRRFPGLHYDPSTGVAKLDTDLLFPSGEATLGDESRELLSEFARILKTPEAAGLRMMVVGHTDHRPIEDSPVRDLYPNNWHLSSARALRVADHLRALGIDESRMGVAGFAKNQPVAAGNTDLALQQNRRVEIFLIAPEVPVVGWTETMPGVYR